MRNIVPFFEFYSSLELAFAWFPIFVERLFSVLMSYACRGIDGSGFALNF
jgi:hypothetical protein